MKQRQFLPIVVIVSILVAAGAYVQRAESESTPPTVTTPAPKPNAQAVQDLKNQVPLDLSKLGDPLPRNLWVELSKLVNPAVVSITTTSVPKQPAQGPLPRSDSRFL